MRREISATRRIGRAFLKIRKTLLSIGRPVGGPLGLRPEMRYTQKGDQTALPVRNSDGGGAESGSATIKVDYVEVPILARLELPAIGPVQPHVLAGPTLGFSVRTGAVVRVGGESEAIDVGGDLGGNAVSVKVGAGADVTVITLVVDARVGLRLSEVPGVLFSARNRGMITTVGVLF